jgi:hypothetical protein
MLIILGTRICVRGDVMIPNTHCLNYKKYFSIRKKSFFEGFDVNLRDIVRIIIKFAIRSERFVINGGIDYDQKTVLKVINKLVEWLPIADCRDDKLGGPRFVVQIDETILNYKCKSHRGRLSSNKTDALCIVEARNSIKKAFECIIPNKRDKTLIPITCSQVANYGFIHESFCHKYEFITDSEIRKRSNSLTTT